MILLFFIYALKKFDLISCVNFFLQLD